MISIIVPTLNEEANVGDLFRSLNQQSWNEFEVIIVDGGSGDQTVDIAKKNGARVIVKPMCREFPSRNAGAEKAKGEILLFTCADIVFPQNLLETVHRKFTRDKTLVALSGPGIPIDAPSIGRIEYEAYNKFRYFLVKLPPNLRRFSTSTNFLAVRKSNFRQIGGFRLNDVNADGILGNQLVNVGKVDFDLKTYVFVSARRMKIMGFLKFNRHYIYMLENFFPALSGTRFIKKLKHRSGSLHKKMHE